MLKFKKIADMGMFGTNCYILPTENKNAVIIDAPCQPELILDLLSQMELNLSAILLTHGHCDHIEAVKELSDKTGCRVYIHEADSLMLENRKKCLADYFHTPFNEFFDATKIKDGDIIGVDDLVFEVISTPGHTLGSVCYLIDEHIFSGDTLFEGSIGRTDFPNGRFDTIIKSISKLMSLGNNYYIHPGHGNSTDLYNELKNNPFLDRLR